MEIGGHDIYYENVNVSEELILSVIKKYWPNMVWETLGEDNTHIFIYPSKEAKENWDKVVLADANDTDLIYVILDGKNTTFVIDSDKKNKHIIDEMERQWTKENL